MATARKPKSALPDPHDGTKCDAPRLESFDALRPGGDPVSVVRCQECGSQTTK
ncbi:hypothetical protein PBI_NESBITT_7 [Streptomyces phage Nesbitt]|uniref:Uncharacterized protein n=2 Tax=Abbeymikolonvirus abbeymikolon TaxID=2734213 RepID=A0A2P1JT11_9CAUD|nr:hypothetical protein HOS57_gp07 [Streptomyces phage AbbeyMikolon]AUG87080.1 hypothetical protein SEA_ABBEYMIKOLON_7 [Streptomyces phage AbbeyMikolon]AVO22264.1 hypothetical protein PBI_NESBITT_7 [Streptomyces phage Nesbitt]